MKTKRQKAILYARVAAKVEGQQPDRLQFQLDWLTVYCQDNNIEIAEIYYDVAHANDYQRVELRMMINELKSGLVEADLLLFTEWSRLTRDILFTGKELYKEIKETGIKPIAIKSKTESEAVIRILSHE